MRIQTIPGAIGTLLLALGVAAPPLAADTPSVTLLPQFRPIGGGGNNQSNPALNAVPGNPEIAVAPLNFAPGSGDPLVSGPNPRTVSNVVSGQKGNGNHDATTTDPTASAWLYVFGQFVDHDLDLESTPANAPAINITVPPGDPVFAAGTSIALTRDQRNPSTNTIVNTVAGYLDLSQLYGSSSDVANSLRNADGTLKSSDNGQYLPVVNDQFVTGDPRVMENPELTAVTALFMREHNYWVGQLHTQHPQWSGDQLYQMARAITTAEYQNIVYQEFLPLLVGSDHVGSYPGYRADVNPQVTQEFSTAAFRVGHSQVSDTQEGLDNNGNVTFTESLAQAFFNTPEIDEANGFNPLLRGVSFDSSQATDVYAVSALRNLLFAPLVGGDVDEVDLIAIDVQRERDVGLGTLNQTRTALGMSPYTSFSQVTSDSLLQKALNSVYGSVDNLDLFMGGLAEDHAQGAKVGPTFQSLIADQFSRLRSGDRFFWLNQGFDSQTSAMISNTRLSDIIKRNTDTTSLQTNVFLAPNPPHVPGPVKTTTVDNHGRLGTPFLLP
ncbi:MAG: peroxidase [Chloroflexi bacterium]|nr:peroxidase [Chloroflexota bacterium]